MPHEWMCFTPWVIVQSSHCKKTETNTAVWLCWYFIPTRPYWNDQGAKANTNKATTMWRTWLIAAMVEPPTLSRPTCPIVIYRLFGTLIRREAPGVWSHIVLCRGFFQSRPRWLSQKPSSSEGRKDPAADQPAEKCAHLCILRKQLLVLFFFFFLDED